MSIRASWGNPVPTTVCRRILLAAALNLAACVPETVTEAIMVLEDVAAGGGRSDLKANTPAPTRLGISVPGNNASRPADLYEPNQPVGGNLVLVPGFTPHGKNDRRVVEFALSFARARFRVLVPDVPGSRLMRVGLDDVQAIADAAVHLSTQFPVDGQTHTALLAISYAVGPTVLATLDARLQGRVDFVVGIGGYYDTIAVTTFVTTGHFRAPGATNWQAAQPHPAAKWFFLKSNIGRLANPADRAALVEIADRKLERPTAPTDYLKARLSPEALTLYELFVNTEPGRVEGLIAALPEAAKKSLGDLSLKERDLSRLAGRLILVHGREDTMIPYTESVALAGAVPQTELFLIEGFSHIDPDSVGAVGKAQLIRAVQTILERRHPTEAN